MRILIFTAATGGGHKRTAKAMEEYFELRLPNSQVQVVDAIKEVNKLVDKIVCGSYEFMATKAPEIYRLFYEQTQKEGRDVSKPLSAMACKGLMASITTFDPDIIITTHPFAAEMVSFLKKRNKIDIPLLSIMTDYGPHRAYLATGVDAYVVPAPECVEPMVELGVARKRIFPLGIPVFQVFHPVEDEELPALRKKLELRSDPDVPTLLMMAGSFGVSNIMEIYNSLMTMPEPLQLVIITGKNKKLYNAFIKKTKNAPKPVKLIYFTDVVQEYMQASDLIITKPGGLTITEAIACNLPMVLFNAIPGQEEDNALFLSKRGMAVQIWKDQDGAEVIRRLLQHPERLRQMHQNCVDFDISQCLPNMAKLITSLAEPHEARLAREIRLDDEIYLDNSATTEVCPEAIRKMVELLSSNYGNPSSLHGMGFAAEKELTAAREIVAKAIGAKPAEITFTSGGTEADNLAIFGAVEAKKYNGNKIVTTAIEHPAVLRCMDELERQGYEVVRIPPVPDGRIDPEAVADAIDENTILVSMMLVNNETGAILPIEAAAKAIALKESPALLHVDAVQAFGKIPIKVKKMKIDLLSVSAHKIHGPKGVGALYVRDGLHIKPLLFGGGQEKNLRPGTEALPAIGGFGAAIKALPAIEDSRKRMEILSDYCKERLSAIPGIVLNSPDDGLPNIVNFSTCKVRSETMIHFLSEHKIYVSGGSACSGGKESHVLTAMKLPRSVILSSIRVSFSMETVEQEIDALVDTVKEGMETLAGDLEAKRAGTVRQKE